MKQDGYQHHMESVDTPAPHDASDHGMRQIVKVLPDWMAFPPASPPPPILASLTSEDRDRSGGVGAQCDGFGVGRREGVIVMHVG